jgi:hypothetical protein
LTSAFGFEVFETDQAKAISKIPRFEAVRPMIATQIPNLGGRLRFRPVIVGVPPSNEDRHDRRSTIPKPSPYVDCGSQYRASVTHLDGDFSGTVEGNEAFTTKRLGA